MPIFKGLWLVVSGECSFFVCLVGDFSLSIHGFVTVAATIWGAYLTTTEDATNPSQLTYAFFLSDLQFLITLRSKINGLPIPNWQVSKGSKESPNIWGRFAMYVSTTVPRLVFFYFLPPFFGSKLLSTSCMLDPGGFGGSAPTWDVSQIIGLFFFENFVTQGSLC